MLFRSVEFFIDLLDGVIGLEIDLDAGVGGFLRQFLFDGHDNLNVVARVDALTADEAVDGRLLGHGADVGRQHNMQKAEAE